MALETLMEGRPNLRPKLEDGKIQPYSIERWQSQVRGLLTKQVSYGSVGRHLLDLILTMDGPMGDFSRRYASTQPPPASRPTRQRRGDVLPIHPSAVKTGLRGVNAENLHWVQATVMMLDYFYCCGWTKPICVPMDPGLSPNQEEAIEILAQTIDRNIMVADQLPPTPKVKELLSSKKFDYMGSPIEHMQDLDAEKVIAAWPAEGSAGVKLITEFLEGEVLTTVSDPTGWWLQDDRMPLKRTRSRVRATDEVWYKICKAAHARNMMRPVADSELHKDRNGHYITNGAGAVAKRKEVGGQVVEVQRFISVLIPTNEHSVQLTGEQDSLPYVGQLTGIVLEEENDLYMESEDFTSAFNLFAVPESWLPHFAFSKKVCASAFGGTKGHEVRPALAVVPMGWHSAVALIQAAVRNIVFTRCGVPRTTSVEKGLPLPDTNEMTVVYLDNFDELRKVRKFGSELELGRASPAHQRFNEVCDELGLSRNRAKQLIMSLTGGIQGGELDGRTGVLKVAKDKLLSFVAISLGMLQSENWKEFHIRHWTGKAAFVAAFRRPLFAILESVFPCINDSVKADVRPGWKEAEEILSFMILAVHAESNLRCQVSGTISCTDASPTGGGCATASAFKDRGLEVPPAMEEKGTCAMCSQELESEPGRVKYPCPRDCGAFGCSVRCAQSHFEFGPCVRMGVSVPRFGERFCGPNYPLTKAVALQGGAVQRPLDILVSDNSWDFFSEPGRKALEHLEEDPALRWRHWGPNCRTFSRARGRPINLKGKGKIKGPARVRSEAQPWGLDRVGKNDQVKVRQDNKMAKRSLRGLEEADRQGGFAGLEHPYESYLWYTEEAERIRSRPGFHTTVWSQCCFGGRRTKWTSLLNNSRRVHLALHKPELPLHPPTSL